MNRSNTSPVGITLCSRTSAASIQLIRMCAGRITDWARAKRLASRVRVRINTASTNAVSIANLQRFRTLISGFAVQELRSASWWRKNGTGGITIIIAVQNITPTGRANGGSIDRTSRTAGRVERIRSGYRQRIKSKCGRSEKNQEKSEESKHNRPATN